MPGDKDKGLGDKDKGLGDKRGCEAGGGGDGILPDGSDAELQQELRGRGVPFGTNLNNQELQQLLQLSHEHEAMREQLQSAELAACPEGLGCAVCMEDFNDSDRVPRNLSCGHSSCTQCLTTMTNKGSVPCPVCRVVTRLPSGGASALTKNFTLMFTAATNHKLAATLKRPADGAGTALRSGKRAAAASGGSVAADPGPPQASTCGAHAHKQVDVICHTCHKAVCSTCLLSTCQAHKTEAIALIANRCVKERLAACDGAKQRFLAAVTHASLSAKVKLTAKINADAARLRAQGLAMFDAQLAVLAASGGAVQELVDATLAAGSAGVAGGRGAEVLMHIARSGGECGFEVVTATAPDPVPNLGHADVIMVPSTSELHQEGHRLLPTNTHLALQCFTAAVARGHGPSHAQLAFMHFKGYFGADKNVDRARKLAAAGAALGCSDSQGVLGLLTHEDERDNGVPEDKEVGERLIQESADAGSAWGQWALGLLHMEWGSEEAPDHFRKAAEQEHSDAQFHLGDWFVYYVDDPNPNEAARYYRLAAEQGHPEAHFRLGELFMSGIGVARDHSEGVRYYRMAAEQGISAAQWQLGQLYENGIGVAQDFAEAARYYRMARAQGHEGAARALSNIRFADDRGRV